MRRVFLIAGCPRSGNALLQFMLDSHPGIRCFGGDKSAEILTTGNLPQDITEPVIGFKIPRWAPMLSRYYSDWRREWGRMPVLFPTRDPRACVASMRAWTRPDGNLLRHAAQWVTHMAERDWGFARQYDRELEILALNPQHRLVIAGAIAWKIHHAQLDICRSRGIPILEVPFIDLARATEPTLRRVCEFLGVDFDNRILRWWEQSHDGIPAAIPPGTENATTNQPLEFAVLFAWQEQLTAEEQEIIQCTTGL